MNRLLPYFDPTDHPGARSRPRSRSGSRSGSWSWSWSWSRSRSRRWFVGLLVAVVAVWAFALQLPGIGRMVLSALLLLAMAGGILAAAMGLGLLGMGLFAVGDRLILRLRRSAPPPKAVDDWWMWN